MARRRRKDTPHRAETLSVVALAGTLEQADVMRATLEAAGIPAFVFGENVSNWLMHMGPAVHPWGIKVAVARRDMPEARAVLNLPRAQDKCAKAPLTSDDYAERAFRAAVYWCWFPPIALLVAYYFVGAILVRSAGPVRRPGRFARHLALAFLLGVVLPAVVGLLVLGTCLGGDSGHFPFGHSIRLPWH